MERQIKSRRIYIFFNYATTYKQNLYKLVADYIIKEIKLELLH